MSLTIDSPVEFALYWLEMNHPYVLSDAERTRGTGMLASDQVAVERVKALLGDDAQRTELTPEEMLALLWVVRNVDHVRLREGPYRPQVGVFSHGALSTATNKVERWLGRVLASRAT